MKILLKVLPTQPKFLGALALIFDQAIPFYAGCKSGYSYTPGFPNVRVHLIKQFNAVKGFKVVLEALKHPDFVWIGGEGMLSLLKAISGVQDVLLTMDEKLKKELLHSYMASFLDLPDEQVKKENTEILNYIIRCLGTVQTHMGLREKTAFPLSLETYYNFWIDIVVKLMASTSLVGNRL